MYSLRYMDQLDDTRSSHEPEIALGQFRDNRLEGRVRAAFEVVEAVDQLLGLEVELEIYLVLYLGRQQLVVGDL